MSAMDGYLGLGPNNWYQSRHDPVLEAHGWQSYSSHGGEGSRLGASSEPPRWQSPYVPAPGVGGWQGLPQETPFQPQISATSLHEQRSRSINGKILQPKDSIDRMIDKFDHMNSKLDRVLKELVREREVIESQLYRKVSLPNSCRNPNPNPLISNSMSYQNPSIKVVPNVLEVNITMPNHVQNQGSMDYQSNIYPDSYQNHFYYTHSVLENSPTMFAYGQSPHSFSNHHQDPYQAIITSTPQETPSSTHPVESGKRYIEDATTDAVVIEEANPHSSKEEVKILKLGISGKIEGETVEADNDPSQKMGDPTVEVTEENRDASQMTKGKAMEAISKGKMDEAFEHLIETNIESVDSLMSNSTDVGKNQVIACVQKLQELNSAFLVSTMSGTLSTEQLKAFQAVVFTNVSLEKAIEFDDYSDNHQPPISFIKSEVRGLFGSLFCDLGPEFTVVDMDEEVAAFLRSFGWVADSSCSKDREISTWKSFLVWDPGGSDGENMGKAILGSVAVSVLVLLVARAVIEEETLPAFRTQGMSLTTKFHEKGAVMQMVILQYLVRVWDPGIKLSVH